MFDRLYAAILSLAGLSFGGFILLHEVATSAHDRDSPDDHCRRDATGTASLALDAQPTVLGKCVRDRSVYIPGVNRGSDA